MNIRRVYWGLLVILSLGLLFEWTSEKKNKSIQGHLDGAAYSSFELGESYLSIESDYLSVVVAIKTGAIVETRVKKYPVENVEGALGFRVLGESKDSAFSYYFKSGFTGVSPNYELTDFGVDFAWDSLAFYRFLLIFVQNDWFLWVIVNTEAPTPRREHTFFLKMCPTPT